MADPIIRPYRPTDRADCYEVCVRTAAADFMVNLGHTLERMLIPQLDEYPAHLQIDLLSELQALGIRTS